MCVCVPQIVEAPGPHSAHTEGSLGGISQSAGNGDRLTGDGNTLWVVQLH